MLRLPSFDWRWGLFDLFYVLYLILVIFCLLIYLCRFFISFLVWIVIDPSQPCPSLCHIFYYYEIVPIGSRVFHPEFKALILELEQIENLDLIEPRLFQDITNDDPLGPAGLPFYPPFSVFLWRVVLFRVLLIVLFAHLLYLVKQSNVVAHEQIV